MIKLIETNYRGNKEIQAPCPKCGNSQMLQNTTICLCCYEPLPILEDLMSIVEYRINFYLEKDVWDY